MAHEKWIAETVATLPALVTVEELAEVLRVTERTVPRTLATGEISSIGGGPGGKRRLVPKSELERYLRALGTA